MSAPQNVIALIFDFDDTLTDDSTTQLLEANGIDTRDFWGRRVAERVQDGWDNALAYLNAILEEALPGRPLENLTNKRLGELGATLPFYQGLPELFTDLQNICDEHRISRPAIEFFIVSGGLEAVVRGSSIARHFTGIWGSCFEEVDGRVARIRNAISFTEKTKYIYAINKGIENEVRRDPYAVNRAVAQENRRVPFGNMIYVGDGLTDVPCFSLIQNAGGSAFGVFDPQKKDSPKKAWEQLVAPHRVSTMNSPRYGAKDDLGSLLRAAVHQVCIKMDLRTQMPIS